MLNLGTLKMPLNAATRAFAFLGMRGGGKTYGGAVFAEELADANIPFVVFDPIDVWWGLKVAADGKGKGLPVVVFGARHADIPLTRDMGRLIAQAVVRDNVNVIISTLGIEGGKTAERHIIAEFSEELLAINNTPRHIFIEEAHEYLPQRTFGAMGKVFNAVSNLVVMGRNLGIGVTLLNQRAATVNKDVLTQCDTLVAFKNTSPQDRKALSEWMEHNSDAKVFKKFASELTRLGKGEFWAWSPEFLDIFDKGKIRARRTFHPDREKIGTDFKMPMIDQMDVAGFVSKFSASIESAKKAAEKPVKPLSKSEQKRVEIQRTEAHTAAIKESIPEGWVSPEEVRGLKNAHESAMIGANAEIRRLTTIIENVARVVGSNAVHISGGDYTPMVAGLGGKNEALVADLPPYEKSIMDAIMKHPNVPFTRGQLAIKAGKSNKSSALSPALYRLVKLNLLERHGLDYTYKI